MNKELLLNKGEYYYTKINLEREYFKTIDEARTHALENINNNYVEYGVVNVCDKYEYHKSIEILRW